MFARKVILLSIMKKQFLFPLILLSLTSVIATGCQQKDKRIRLSFGSYVATGMIDISYEKFVEKMDAGENMVVVTYDSIFSIDCSCWNGFKAIVDKYVDDNDLVIYQIDRNEFAGKEDYGLTLLKENSNPTCFVASHGKVTNEYRAGSKNNEAIFTTEKGFASALNKIVKEPQVMLVDRTYLRNAIDSGEKVIVYQARAKCGDCNYCTPNCLLPYSESNEMKTKVLLMDLQVPGIYYDDQLNKNDATYNAYKAEYQMTEETNAKYGYSTGVVPTFQVWQNKELKDACVYFNDSIGKNDNDKLVVTETYYTKERVNNLAYTNTILQGMEINPEEATEYPGYGFFWSQEGAAKYHNEILKSFLNYYTK